MKTGRYLITLCLFLALTVILRGQAPPGYYNSANGLSGAELQQALHDIIDNHTILTYNPGIWDAVQLTDARSDGTVWDMYSDNPSGTNPYNYTFGTDQCGDYNSESDCYNREHSFPKSWFDDASPMYTDLNHIFPTDGYVNNRRGNYAFGETNNPSWTSQNGSKVGSSSVSGFSGTVFEPIDEYKGDFARAHLYMAVRYYGEDSSWPGGDMTDGSQPKEWALDMLLQWHSDDPVSQKETDRNNQVFNLQGNRNPFIDEPAFADRIWSSTGIAEMNIYADQYLKIYPNPVDEDLRFTIKNYSKSYLNIKIYSLTGLLIKELSIKSSSENRINIQSLEKGSYLLLVRTEDNVFRSRFIKL
jgi:endonuclease I